MRHFERARDDKQGSQTYPHEKWKDMSSSTKDNREHQQPAPGAPRANRVTLISAIVAVVIVGVIIAYAVLRGNRAVPGAVATEAPLLPPPLQVGMKAPSFSVPSKIGTFSSDQLAGTPYMLEIFATWCPHCQRMTKVLRAIRAQVPQAKFAMISVTGSPYASNSTPDQTVPENQADVDSFESAFGVTWPSFYDPDLSVAKKWGLDGFPTIYIVNAKGVIVYATSGEVTESTLLNAIRKAGA